MATEYLCSIPCLQLALVYRSRGWCTTPLCGPRHVSAPEWHKATCRSPGKRPYGYWRERQSEFLGIDHLHEAFHQHPDSNVGVVLGRVSGLAGVDLDSEQALQRLQELLRGEPEPTSSFCTGRGLRLLYALQEGVQPPRSRMVEPGIEVLSEGRLSVMPPSTHHTGRVYRFLNKLPVATAPEWIYSLKAGRTAQPPRRTEGESITEGKRNDTLFRLACALRRHGATFGELLACLDLFNGRCVPPLEERELQEIATSASTYRPQYQEASNGK